MTPEQAKAKLEELGVKSGSWQEISDRLVQLTSVAGQRDGLEKLQAFLEAAVVADHQRLAALKAQLARLKFGGGA